MTFSHVPAWMRPRLIGQIGLWYAVVHLLSGFLLIALYPNPTFLGMIGDVRSTISSAMLIAMLAGLTLALDHFVDVLWNHVIPNLERR